MIDCLLKFCVLKQLTVQQFVILLVGLPIHVATLCCHAASLISMESTAEDKARKLNIENILILLPEWDLYVAFTWKKIALEFHQQKG